EHAGEGLAELGQVRGVDVGVGRLVRRDLGEQLHEGGGVDDPRWGAAQGRGGEGRVHVEVARAVASVDQPAAPAGDGVGDELEAVGEQVLGEDGVDFVGRDAELFSHGDELLGLGAGRLVKAWREVLPVGAAYYVNLTVSGK